MVNISNMDKTPNAQHIQDDLLARFPQLRAGAWDCRRIAGSLTWSQHAYTEVRPGADYEGNAVDVFGPVSILDQAVEYLKAAYPTVIAHLLWRVKDHGPQYPPVHFHFDTWPQGTGTPPCKGGPLRVKHRDGKLGTHFTDDFYTIPPPVPPPIGDHDMTAAEFASRLSADQVTAICGRAGQGGVWVINPTSADRVGVTNYYLSILNTPTNPDWVPFFQEVQAEALVNAAINP